jgi:hypothetical protein
MCARTAVRPGYGLAFQHGVGSLGREVALQTLSGLLWAVGGERDHNAFTCWFAETFGVCVELVVMHTNVTKARQLASAR